MKRLSVQLSIAAGLLTGLALYVGVPAIVVDANRPEFTWPGSADTPFLNIVATYWPWFASVVALMAIPPIVLPEQWARWWAAAAVVVATYVWAHGVFQTHNFGDIDGRMISLAVPMWQSLLEMFVILAGSALAFGLALRYPRPTLAIQLVLAGGMVLQAAPELKSSSWQDVSGASSQMREVASFSPKSNALVVLMDSMSSDVFEKVVMETPARRKAFAGFVSYSDTVGAAPSTYLAVPTIHSGRTYQPGTAMPPFLATVRDHSVLTKVDAAGFRGILVNPIGPCPQRLECLSVRSALDGDDAWVREKASYLLDVVRFRLAPLGQKGRVYHRDDLRPQATGLAADRFILESNELLRGMSKSASSGSSQPTLKFLHLMSTHPPAIFDRDCRYVGAVQPSADNFEVHVGCALDTLASVLTAMKRHGVYDNTAIMLIADHGNPSVASTRIPDSKRWGQLVASANPTFAIRQPRADGPFRRAAGEVAIGDFGATLCDLLNVCRTKTGTSALEKQTGRARIFNHYEWRHEYWTTQKLPGVVTYAVRGPIDDPGSWMSMGMPLDAGAEVDFADKRKTSRYLQYGWSEPDQNGVWTVTNDARLSVTAAGRAPLKLVLEASGFIAGGPMTASVSINGRQAGTLSFNGETPTRKATLVVSKLGPGATVNVDFRIDEPRSPRELGLSADERKLGIQLRRLTLAPG